MFPWLKNWFLKTVHTVCDYDIDPDEQMRRDEEDAADSEDRIYLDWDRQPEVTTIFRQRFGLELVFGSAEKIISGYNDRNEEFEEYWDCEHRPTTYDELEEKFQSNEHREISDLLRFLIRESPLDYYCHNVGVKGVGAMADMVVYDKNHYAFVEVQSKDALVKPERLKRKLLLASRHPTIFVVGLFTGTSQLDGNVILRGDTYNQTLVDVATTIGFKCPSCGERVDYNLLVPHEYPDALPDYGPLCPKCETNSTSWHEKSLRRFKMDWEKTIQERLAREGCWDNNHRDHMTKIECPICNILISESSICETCDEPRHELKTYNNHCPVCRRNFCDSCVVDCDDMVRAPIFNFGSLGELLRPGDGIGKLRRGLLMPLSVVDFHDESKWHKAVDRDKWLTLNSLSLRRKVCERAVRKIECCLKGLEGDLPSLIRKHTRTSHWSDMKHGDMSSTTCNLFEGCDVMSVGYYENEDRCCCECLENKKLLTSQQYMDSVIAKGGWLLSNLRLVTEGSTPADDGGVGTPLRSISKYSEKQP